jgi:RNA polymerase sigma-70 factor (ECF subfamily)
VQNTTKQSSKILIPDKPAFELLFREYYGDLCSFACSFLKDLPASEEIVQDIFFNLWTKRDVIEIKTSIKSYLYQSTRNRCLNTIKHIEVREKYKLFNEEQRSYNESIEEDPMIESELAQRIENAIEALPRERKRIFKMSRYEGLKYREIAEELDISQKTVENQMGKALRFLKEQLIEYLPLIGMGVYFWFNNFNYE